MNSLQEKISRTKEGLLPSISQRTISSYKSAMVIAVLLCSIPLISYFIM